MSSISALLPIVRLASLGTVVLFSLIVLALSAHLTSVTSSLLGTPFSFAALGIAASVLSFLSLPALIAVDHLRKGAFTSMIAVELGWLGVLWVLWLATGANSAERTRFSTGCNFSYSSIVETVCHESQAVTAFSFLNWIILFGYTSILLVLSIIAATRGHNVWFSAVKDTDFFAPRAAGASQHNHEKSYDINAVAQAPVATQYPPQTVAGYAQPSPAAPGWAGQPQGPAQSPYPQV